MVQSPASPPVPHEAPSTVGPAATASPCRPAAPGEPVLALDQIQGNVVPGFHKNHQTLLYLAIDDPARFRGWLARIAPEVATAAEVLAFNRLYKALRFRRRRNPPLQVSWLNLAFSAAGLEKLGAATAGFRDAAFRAGLAARSARLADPAVGPGSAGSWKVGGPGREADVLVLLAADAPGDLAHEAARLAPGWRAAGDRAEGARLLLRDEGAVLPSPDSHREHFGFSDGISQPGLRGRASADPHDVLTPRQNPHDREQGKPGQELIWPGEFVFGYDDEETAAGEAPPPATPGWARNGSYLVVRRLLQDVHGFRELTAATAAALGLCPELLAAKLGGRWRSGAPLPLAAQSDAPALGTDDCRNNDFVYDGRPPAALAGPAHRCECAADRPALEADPERLACPLAAHTRKMNPRDDVGRFDPIATPEDTRRRRILRRGIPFGPPAPALPDGVERGLHFLCYQTSIVGQFEHLQTRWANAVEADGILHGPRPYSAGHDPFVGREPSDPTAARRFLLPLRGPDGKVVVHDLELPAWVTPDGGGYFFAPSLATVAALAAGDALP